MPKKEPMWGSVVGEPKEQKGLLAIFKEVADSLKEESGERLLGVVDVRNPDPLNVHVILKAKRNVEGTTPVIDLVYASAGAEGYPVHIQYIPKGNVIDVENEMALRSHVGALLKLPQTQNMLRTLLQQ